MMSNEWFRHDYNAHDDIKQKRILKAVGLAGIGLYWYLVEIIYQNGGQMADDDIRLEAELVGGLDLLKSLQEFNLLSLDPCFCRARSAVGFQESPKGSAHRGVLALDGFAGHEGGHRKGP